MMLAPKRGALVAAVLVVTGCAADGDDETLNITSFNASLVRAFNGQLFMYSGEQYLNLLNILGQLAFFARVYRMWIVQPGTGRTQFLAQLPSIRLNSEHTTRCSEFFADCLSWLWEMTSKRNAFIFGDEGNTFTIERSEVVRLIDNQMYDFDFSTIYFMCWMTMNRVDIFKYLPYCDIQPMDSFVLSSDPNSEGSSSAHKWYSKEFYIDPAKPTPPVGPLDMQPFRCATQSFCPDECQTFAQFCLGDSKCGLKAEHNEDLQAMLRGNWNASCSCPSANFSYMYETYQCVDVDECLEQKRCRNREQCVNTIGSYMCVCQMGYIKTDQGCVGPTIQRTVWSGPAVDSARRLRPFGIGNHRFSFYVVLIVAILV